MEIKLDTKIYSLDAIKRAIYLFAPQAVITFPNNRYVCITTNYDVDEGMLRQNLLDIQLQLDLEKEFFPIRNMLVAQALEPYQEIDDLLVLKHHD